MTRQASNWQYQNGYKATGTAAFAPAPKTPPPPQKIPEAVPKPRMSSDWGFPIDITEDDLIIDGVEIVEEEMILPAEAVAIVQTRPRRPPPWAKLLIDFVERNLF